MFYSHIVRNDDACKEQFNEVIARRREDVGTFVKDKDEGD